MTANSQFDRNQEAVYPRGSSLNGTNQLVLQGITKSFGKSIALSDVNLRLNSGELVALMGPNGAGKSVLLKILDGIFRADSGQINFGGKDVASLGSRNDVAFIHQDLGLVDTLSITENLRLGQSPMRWLGMLLDRRKEQDWARSCVAKVGLDVDVRTLIGDLSPAEKTLVALSRALAKGATTLFVDEATSTLPQVEARRLVEALNLLVDRGALVVMVTHRLSEVLDFAHRIVVLLDGRISCDEKREHLDRERLVRELLARAAGDSDNRSGADPIFEDASAARNEDAARPRSEALTFENVFVGRAGPIDFTLNRGEVVGLTGLPGSGLHDVAYAAFGSIRPRKGRLLIDRTTTRSLVPPFRELEGGFDTMSISTNVTVSSLVQLRNAVRMLSLSREKKFTMRTIDALSIVPGDPGIDFSVLSGGNKQKVIFGRSRMRNPDIYVLCEPTRGVDIATREEIYRIIRQMRSAGGAVLVVSSDVEDLLAVSDRIGVVHSGGLQEPKSLVEWDVQQLELLV